MRRVVRALAVAIVVLSSCVLPALSRWWWPHATVEALLTRGLAYWMRAVALLALVAVAMAAWRTRFVLARNRDWIAAAVLVAITGPLVAWYLAPRHAKVFFDEDIYMQIGVTMAREDRAGIVGLALPDPSRPEGWRSLAWSLNKEPVGASFLFSLGAPLLGVEAGLGGHVNLVLFGFGILGLAFLARQAPHLAARPWAALVPAALHAAWPENLRWAVTAAAEPGAVALGCWALAWAGRCGQTRDPLDRVAACAIAALAIPMRPEGLLLAIPFVVLAAGPGMLACIRARRSLPAVVRRSLPWAALLALLVAPHLVQLAIVAGEDWGAAGPKFTLGVVPAHLAENLGYWFLSPPAGRNTPPAPPLVGVLALLGLIGLGAAYGRMARSRTGWSARSSLPWIAAIGAWGATSFGVFLPFYAGSYHYGSDVRFSLLIVPVVGILAAAGTEVLVCALASGPTCRRLFAVAVLVPAMAPAFLQVAVVTDESWQARADRAGIAAFAACLEPGAIVASHVPSAWLMEGVASVQAAKLASSAELRDALATRYDLYLHQGYWDLSAPPRGRVADVVEAGRRLRDLGSWEEVAVFESRGGAVSRLLRWRAAASGSPDDYFQ